MFHPVTSPLKPLKPLNFLFWKAITNEKKMKKKKEKEKEKENLLNNFLFWTISFFG